MIINDLFNNKKTAVAEGSKMARADKSAKAPKPKDQQEYDAVEKYRKDLAQSYNKEPNFGIKDDEEENKWWIDYDLDEGMAEGSLNEFAITPDDGSDGKQVGRWLITYMIKDGTTKEKIMVGKNANAVSKYFEFKYRRKPLSVVPYFDNIDLRGSLGLDEQGMAEAYQFKGGFPFDVDHMPGPTIKRTQTGCKRCHGKGYVYKTPDGQVHPMNRPDANTYKCGKCGGIGFVKVTDQGVAEVSQQTLQSYRKKASAQKRAADDVVSGDADDETWKKNVSLSAKRRQGIDAANKRLGVAENMSDDMAAMAKKKFPNAYISKDGQEVQKPENWGKKYVPPAAATADLEKQQRDLTAKYPNIDELVRRAELNRDPDYEMADGEAYYAARDAEQNYQKLRQIQRVIQGLNESLDRSHLP